MNGRAWTPHDLDRLHALIGAGIGYSEVARRLGRSRDAVIIKSKLERCVLLRIGGVLTACEVGRLLGLRCSKLVSKWITRGMLSATNGGTAHRPLWRVQIDDLWTFLEQPNFWMTWQPERITDAALREWAQELRNGQPRWLPIGEVARRYSVGMGAVNDWIHRGDLPATRWGNWWVREDALIGFTPPCDRALVVRPCPECGRAFNSKGLGMHRQRAHGARRAA